MSETPTPDAVPCGRTQPHEPHDENATNYPCPGAPMSPEREQELRESAAEFGAIRELFAEVDRLTRLADMYREHANHYRSAANEAQEALQAAKRGVCCDLHRANDCCDPKDCGPCCEDCPTCPTLLRHAAEPATGTEYGVRAGGRVMDIRTGYGDITLDSLVRREQEDRAARYRDMYPDAVLVTRTATYTEWTEAES